MGTLWMVSVLDYVLKISYASSLMFYMPTNFAFQVRKRLKQGLLATSLVKGTSRPDGTVASESAEVAL